MNFKQLAAVTLSCLIASAFTYPVIEVVGVEEQLSKEAAKNEAKSPSAESESALSELEPEDITAVPTTSSEDSTSFERINFIEPMKLSSSTSGPYAEQLYSQPPLDPYELKNSPIFDPETSEDDESKDDTRDEVVREIVQETKKDINELLGQSIHSTGYGLESGHYSPESDITNEDDNDLKISNVRKQKQTAIPKSVLTKSANMQNSGQELVISDGIHVDDFASSASAKESVMPRTENFEASASDLAGKTRFSEETMEARLSEIMDSAPPTERMEDLADHVRKVERLEAESRAESDLTSAERNDIKFGLLAPTANQLNQANPSEGSDAKPNPESFLHRLEPKKRKIVPIPAFPRLSESQNIAEPYYSDSVAKLMREGISSSSGARDAVPYQDKPKSGDQRSAWSVLGFSTAPFNQAQTSEKQDGSVMESLQNLWNNIPETDTIEDIPDQVFGIFGTIYGAFTSLVDKPLRVKINKR